MKTFRRLNLGLLALLIGVSVWLWPQVPDRIPMHFGLDGTADGWTARSISSWFAMPALAVALNVLLLGVASWSSRSAKRINLPDKERLLRLPPEGQAAVLARVKGAFDVIALPLTMSFVLVQSAIWVTASGGDGRVFVFVLLAFVMVSGPIGLIAFLLPVQREMDRQHRLHARGMAGGSTP